MPLPTTAEEIVWDQAITLRAAADFLSLSTETIRWHTNRKDRKAGSLRTIKIAKTKFTTYRWIYDWCTENMAAFSHKRPTFPIAGAAPPPDQGTLSLAIET